MLYSMTGFGREEATIHDRQVIVEIKSLNGKQFDLNAKLPYLLRPYELDIRSMLGNKLVRGSIELIITVMHHGTARPMAVNTELAGFYYLSMKQIAERFDLPQEYVLSTLMRMPEVVTMEQDVMPEEEWNEVKKLLDKAAGNLMKHRKAEGSSIKADLEICIRKIEAGLESILPFEPKRIEKVKSRIMTALAELGSLVAVDGNRLEQELIYYIERIDFSEEKTRLIQHCKYFTEILNGEDDANGKKLGFILQEIGREINTLGSKANDADIQKLIIGMKDELEKAKEQILNVL